MPTSQKHFFFASRRRHARWNCDWSSDVCSSDLVELERHRIRAEILVVPNLPLLEGDAVRLKLHETVVARDQEPHGSVRLLHDVRAGDGVVEIGRASCRERACGTVWLQSIQAQL